MLDEFSNYYADFLNTTYDCVDRIILNAYFSLGHNPGGFRVWWRNLRGSEDDLSDTYLMRFAGRMSRRIRAFGKGNDIPVIDCHYGDRKHKIAEAYIPKTPDFVGVFLIDNGACRVEDMRIVKLRKIVMRNRSQIYRQRGQ